LLCKTLIGYNPDMAENSPFVAIQEVADLLELTPQRIYQLVRANEIPAVKIAGRIRIPRQAFMAWLDEKNATALAAVR
jgi:excisionase family DNA binding protein